jgi:GH15 family glucan-1,4-alpha-glucosidase
MNFFLEMYPPACNTKLMYRPLADYGIIGNCRSCALVSKTGSIDFCSLPDFDSEAFLLSLLDDDKGGYFKLTPTGFYQTHQQYVENTNVLETIFFNHNGRVSLQDFMPVGKNNLPKEYGSKIIRLVKAVRGNHSFDLILKITPDFAREKILISKNKNQVLIRSLKYVWVLNKKHHNVTFKDNLITIKFDLKAGEQEFFSLSFYPVNAIIPSYTPDKINQHLAAKYDRTIHFWQNWAARCRYEGVYRPQVIRSVLALKLLTFSPTGAIVAAATTSIPEKIGGGLNWDYRYTWLRDASFTLYAFLGLGYTEEANAFMDWLEKVCIKEGATLNIMYGIHGEEELKEKELPHLDGYMKSKPVRIGNGAAHQKQFDIFGEVLTAINLYINAGGELSEPMKGFVKKLVEYCCIHWKEKDAGIWEGRGEDQHHTYSKIMCWTGVDRGIRIAKSQKIRDVDFVKWEKTKTEIKDDILRHGYDKELGSFIAHYGSKSLDTSTLNIPMVGLLPANDPKMVATLDKVMTTLTIDWFVLRTSDTENKLQEGEGTFFLSTFWLIDCLSLLGQTDEARIWLEKVISIATPLGLYAEEYDPITKNHLGNFPQAFTHLGLINSVLNLTKAEVYGKEGKPTVPSERLTQVIKSVLKTQITPPEFDRNPVGYLKRLLRIRS